MIKDIIKIIIKITVKKITKKLKLILNIKVHWQYWHIMNHGTKKKKIIETHLYFVRNDHSVAF